MKQFRLALSIPAVLLMLSPSVASGDSILYQQPSLFPRPFSSWTSTYDPVVYGHAWTSYDSFRVSSRVAIRGVAWQGFVFDTTSLGSSPVDAAAFTVSIYTDRGGQPVALLYSNYLVRPDYSQVAAGTVDFFGNGKRETIYNYLCTLSAPFNPEANTTYWISIVGTVPYPGFWSWTAGTGGDSITIQDSISSQRFVRPQDRTFTLIGLRQGEFPVGVDVDDRGGYGLIFGDVKEHPEFGTPPFNATVGLKSDLHLWLGVASQTGQRATLVPTNRGSLSEHWLAKHGLMAPSVSPKWDAQFPAIGSSVSLSVSMSTMAARLNILDILLKLADAPITSDDIAADLDSILNDLGQAVGVAKAAGRFVPTPTSKAAYLRAVADAVFDLVDLKPGDYAILKKIVEHATHGSSTLDVEALKRLLNPVHKVALLKDLLQYLADVLTLSIQTRGDSMVVNFTGSVLRH